MILIESCFISFREINLNLSTVMWQQLQEASIVKDFHSFQLQVRSVEDKNETFEESCGPPIYPFRDQLYKNFRIENEGFPMIQYNFDMCHVRDHLGDDYVLRVTPVIEDPRKDKKSDYSYATFEEEKDSPGN